MTAPFQDAKTALLDATGLTQDAAHVYIGLGVLFLAAVLGRWRIGDWQPLAIVALVALAGEWWDMIEIVRADKPVHWPMHARDLFNTLVWPVLLTLLARTRLFRR